MKKLKRYPYIVNDKLQAWDASDELVISHFDDIDPIGQKVLVINDSFGAISSSLIDKGFDISIYTDSYISYKATLINTKNRGDISYDLDSIEGSFDYIVIKLPKNLSFFEDILCKITFLMHRNSKVVYSSMLKHLSKGVFPLIQKYIGDTSTSLAKKKARLIHSNFEMMETPSKFPFSSLIDGFSKDFTYHSNLFSRGKLDIGTRFFLDFIPNKNYQNILDLGCANGIIGIKAKQLNPNANIFFSDESFMAIKSSRVNFEKHIGTDANFEWTNCYEVNSDVKFDLILCNPPFHQNNTVGDFIALQMFKDAKRVLKKGGELVVIGNSHLAYPSKLKRIFGNNSLLAKNKKFIISCSTK